MQKLKQFYRSTYPGENVVTTLSLQNREWLPEAEFIPNSVFNTFTTSQALAIGNGTSREKFELRHIANHKAGFGGSNRLQTYGCNGLYKTFTPDFLIAVGDATVDELAVSGYTDEHIVYVNSQHIQSHPGKFYLIPQNIPYDSGSLAVYMACFDGHKKIYMLGYDSHDSNEYGTFWTKTLSTIMSTYSDVEFIRVMPTASWEIPLGFSSLINFRQIGFREFVLEADIG
jgi:hypothetical protein